MMKIFRKLRLWILGCLIITCSSKRDKVSGHYDKEKPNIVFVLIDDMGWSDVGYNGGADGFYETPQIDSIANDGIVFNRFYPGGPNCAPTRACIISGLYTPRTKIYQPNGQSKGKVSDMRWYVPAKNREGDETSLDSRTELDESIVSIAEVMNNAGYVTSRIGKWHLGPDTQGFDEATSDGYTPSGKRFYNDSLATDRMTRAAAEFIERNRDNAFFLYFSLWDVHTPLTAKMEVVRKYEKKWENWADKSRKWDPTYAAMIEVTDNSVGQLRAKLTDLGLIDNTLFIVASDNGGPAGHTSNLPLRGAKGAMYEGGIRTFATAMWPGEIVPGITSDYPVTGVDFLPTFAEIGGAELPKTQTLDGQSFVGLFKTGQELQSRDIFWHYPLYLGGRNPNKGWPGDNILPKYGTSDMMWRAVPSSAIVSGDWKLIYFYEYDSYELYNLGDDPGEQNDLSESNSKMAKKLYQRLMDWVKETGADIPVKDNPDFVR